MSSSVVIDPLVSALNVVGATSMTIVSAFGLLLAAQFSLFDQYFWNQDFLTRTRPMYRPYPYAGHRDRRSHVIVPDNACQRTFWFDPKFPHISELRYDYIVVGSGPGGAVVASRLSENPAVTVLLVEAGGDPIAESAIPQFFPFMLRNIRSFNYTAEYARSSAQAYLNGVAPLAAGMMLGGSSGTNAMLYLCGCDRDWDSWQALGNPGWNYRNILQYIKKLEGNTDSLYANYKGGAYHGTNGPLGVSRYGSKDHLIQPLKDAFKEMNYKFLQDFNSQEYNGLVELQGTIKDGERMSAARAYLLPAKRRPNLTVMKESFVEKVLFSGTRAIGVNIVTKSITCPNIKAYARKEIILSAGAFGTPKILQKSGIGRPADLTPFNIPIIKNLAVGYNYQDHPKSVHMVKINPKTQSQSIFDMMVDATLYLTNRTGKFSNLNVVNFGGLINTIDPNARYPDVHYTFYRFEKSQEFMREIMSRFSFKPEFVNQIVKINENFEVLFIYTEVVNPVARGTVKLRSNDPFDYPKIDTNFFENQNDIDTILRGYGQIEQLVNTTAFRNLNAELVKFNLPECDVNPYLSYAYKRCYIRYFTSTQWHPSGTAKMGPANDPNAVVDGRLRVHGITGLRVSDASIMPNVITSNLQCPVYAIAEKAADMIKQDNI